jgi:hypothetical protein
MQISQLDDTQQQRFSSQHGLHYPLADNRTMLVLSGIVTLDFQCPGWSNENTVIGWFEEPLSLEIALPAGFLKQGQSFVIEQAVPFLGLNAMDGTTNVGWGVKSLALASGQTLQASVQLQADLAVSRSGEVLRQLGYHLSLLGCITN